MSQVLDLCSKAGKPEGAKIGAKLGAKDTLPWPLPCPLFAHGCLPCREAQKNLFGHTTVGDLRPYLSAFFDTTSGPKVGRRASAGICPQAL